MPLEPHALGASCRRRRQQLLRSKSLLPADRGRGVGYSPRSRSAAPIAAAREPLAARDPLETDRPVLHCSAGLCREPPQTRMLVRCPDAAAASTPAAMASSVRIAQQTTALSSMTTTRRYSKSRRRGEMAELRGTTTRSNPNVTRTTSLRHSNSDDARLAQPPAHPPGLGALPERTKRCDQPLPLWQMNTENLGKNPFTDDEPRCSRHPGASTPASLFPESHSISPGPAHRSTPHLRRSPFEGRTRSMA